MKKSNLLTIALTLCLITSCKAFGIKPAATVFSDDVLGAVTDVVEVHDVYAAEYVEPESSLYLAESAAWFELVSTVEEIPVAEFSRLGDPVMIRHDFEVNGDTRLDPLSRRVYLRSTAELRKYVEAAKANQ